MTERQPEPREQRSGKQIPHLGIRCVLGAAVWFAAEWAGVTWHHAPASLRFGPPRRLMDIWWHLPLLTTLLYLLGISGYFQRRRWFSLSPLIRRARQEDDDDKPVTLDL